MITKNCASLILIIVLFSSCTKKEEALTVPVKFPETTYQPLGTFDDFGKPNYLVTSDVISPSLLSYISNTLPERIDMRTAHPELLNSTAIGDIDISQQSDVFITFVSQGSGVTNTLAFYTYPTNKPPASSKDIKDIKYIFPNAGQGTTLQAGDKVKIGRFDAGNSVGFVLLSNCWNPVSKSFNNDVVHFCSNDVLNPEVNPNLKKHAVLINYAAENKVIIGFEDLDRTRADCDNDFNDVMVYATVTP